MILRLNQPLTINIGIYQYLHGFGRTDGFVSYYKYNETIIRETAVLLGLFDMEVDLGK